jgi:phosphomannomutase/phosphoglucomutase
MAPEWRVLDMSWRSFYWLTFAEIALVLAIMVAVFRRLTSELSLRSAAVFHEFVKDRLSGRWMGKTYVTPLQEFELSLTNIQSLNWGQAGESVNEDASVEEDQESGEFEESYTDLLYQGGEAIEVDDGAASLVPREVFRPYDIRGVAGKTLTAELVYKIGLAFAAELRQKGKRTVVVGRDGRLSGPRLSESLIRGLRASGCDVVDIGRVPTPMVYFATHQLEISSGIMVTGSHNPAEYNGLKMVMQGESLSAEAIQDIYWRVVDDDFDQGKSEGGFRSHNLYGDYMARIFGDVKLARKMKVVVDCGNGAASEAAPLLLRGLGCEVVELYCDVDGNFPNHHPDPSQLENLKDLVAAVKENKADIGLAYDGDGDRLGVVDSRGQVFWPDRQMMLFAADVLKAHPGSQIIYDVKCSRHLPQFIKEKGGSPLMWQSGHSVLKAKLRETKAPLAGELSGHIFFNDRWFGFDDGLYAAARLLEILSKDERPSHQVFADLPDAVSTPEIRVPMNEGEQYQFMKRLQQEAKFPGAELITIDGIRAEFKDGWGLVRASNTTPCLTLRFEADSEEAFVRIQEVFKGILLDLDSKLKLPF